MVRRFDAETGWVPSSGDLLMIWLQVDTINSADHFGRVFNKFYGV